MRIWKRKTLRRLTIFGVVLVGGVTGALLWPRGDGAYVPGEEMEGITDTLGRALPEDHPPVTFTEVTAEAGLLFHHFDAVRSGRLTEDMGSGVALGDADGDGWTDVFLVNLAGTMDGADNDWGGVGSSCRMFRNLGNGKFEDVTDRSNLGLRALANGAAWLDVDGDGDLDLFVTSFESCYLFRNDGDLKFTDISKMAGIDGFRGFWTGIATGDYDRDGDLDIYVCGYVEYREVSKRAGPAMKQYNATIPALLNPSVFDPQPNLLLQNRGDGTFDEVAESAGVLEQSGRGLGATFTDLNNDGWPDLYVANDVSDNALYLNQADGTFKDYTSETLLGDYRGAMGMAVNDFDQDQDLDLFITHWVSQENALYENVTSDFGSEGEPAKLLFMDEADRFGLGQIALDMVGWATGFFDFDNDGLRDLFVINGSTIPQANDPTQLVAQRAQLFWNAGPERGFFELGAAAGPFFTEKRVGRGGAHFDYDLDGDLDIVVVGHGESAHLLRNDSQQSGGSVLIRLRQPEGNRFAIGASVIVKWGGKGMIDQIGAQGSYLSQHAVGELSFGLGDAAQMDSVVVRWPDGTTETAGPFAAGSLVTWQRGSAPKVEILPGKIQAAAAEPSSIAEKRHFVQLLREATRLRVAGDLTAAEAQYRRALKIWPGHWDGLYYLGNVLAELGREAEALEQFEKLTIFQPQGSRAWMQIGRLHLPGGDPKLDDLEAAHAAFSRCHQINPEESEPSVQLGIVAILQDDLELADALFAAAAAHNARSVPARWFRGWIAFQSGDRPAAQAFLDAALALVSKADTTSSTSNEGDTAEGGAMTADQTSADTDAFIHRWRSLQNRQATLDEEYAIQKSKQD
jgi:enediyne biosynthesis protein E4